MFHFNCNFKKIFVIFLVCKSLNCTYPDIEGFNHCKKKLDAFFGLKTSSFECAKHLMLNITFQMNKFDDSVTTYMNLLRTWGAGDIKSQDIFCKERVYGTNKKSGYTEIDLLHSYNACVGETEAFGSTYENKFEIYRNAIDFHELKQLNSVYTHYKDHSKNKFFIHQPGSHGEAYLIHISNVVKLPKWCDQIHFCHWNNHIPYLENDEQENTKFANDR